MQPGVAHKCAPLNSYRGKKTLEGVIIVLDLPARSLKPGHQKRIHGLSITVDDPQNVPGLRRRAQTHVKPGFVSMLRFVDVARIDGLALNIPARR